MILSFKDAIVSIARCVLFRVAIVLPSLFVAFLIFLFRVGCAILISIRLLFSPALTFLAPLSPSSLFRSFPVLAYRTSLD